MFDSIPAENRPAISKRFLTTESTRISLLIPIELTIDFRSLTRTLPSLSSKPGGNKRTIKYRECGGQRITNLMTCVSCTERFQTEE